MEFNVLELKLTVDQANMESKTRVGWGQRTLCDEVGLFQPAVCISPLKVSSMQLSCPNCAPHSPKAHFD